MKKTNNVETNNKIVRNSCTGKPAGMKLKRYLKRKRWIAAVLLILLSLILAGCGSQQPAAYVRLSNLKPVPSAQESGQTSLRVALAVGLSPTQSVARYQTLVDYLARKLNRPVELIQRKTYKEVDDLLREGKVDIAFVCSSSYVIGHDMFNERLLAVPIIGGLPYYQSVIIANAATGIKNWGDLRRRSFAFTDPQSASGALYALRVVQDQGGLSYFKSYIYTYAVGNSLTAVQNHLVDAGAVDSNTLNRALTINPQLASAIRIVDTSPQYANNPVVASPKLEEKTFLAVQRILLEMNQDPDGSVALQAAGIDSFQLLDDHMYDSVRALVNKTGGTEQ